MQRFHLRHPLVKGTLILTLTGFLSRFIGFFYRIFLSRAFGAEGMGIYQLTSPVLALSFALTAAGIQTAISKFTAGRPGQTGRMNDRDAMLHLMAGFLLSMGLSVLCTLFIYLFSEEIAAGLIKEPRTAPLLRILSLSIPMASVHSCINGYFYGKSKTMIPSLCQLSEQIVRVGSVYIIYTAAIARGLSPTIGFAVLGLVIGEGASMIVSLIAIHPHIRSLFSVTVAELKSAAGNIRKMAVPLSLNRILINFLMSIESIFIPEKLLSYGYDKATALSVYGILTGMALPLILFPNALTGSVCVLLLPVVSEAEAKGNRQKIALAIQKSIRYGFFLGVFFSLVFFFLGGALGRILYHNALAGRFIMILGFLCPLMYIAGTLGSILNGLGHTGLTFLFSTLSLLVRLLFVFFLIPVFGINGYLLGLLVSQLIQTLLCVLAVRAYH